MLTATTTEPQRPDLIDPEALHRTIAYLTAQEAFLRDPLNNPRPPHLVTLLDHAAYGCITSVEPEVGGDGEPLFLVSIDGAEPHELVPSDYLCLRVGTAFGFRISDDLVSHGIERSDFRREALAAFDRNASAYPVTVPREQFANMLDLAFGLADRIQGSDVDGLFPVTILAAPEAVMAEVNR